MNNKISNALHKIKNYEFTYGMNNNKNNNKNSNKNNEISNEKIMK